MKNSARDTPNPASVRGLMIRILHRRSRSLLNLSFEHTFKVPTLGSILGLSIELFSCERIVCVFFFVGGEEDGHEVFSKENY